MDIATFSRTVDGAAGGRENITRKCSSIAQKNELKPWQVKEWVIPTADADARVRDGNGAGCL